MRQCRHYLLFLLSLCFVHEFAGSQGFHRRNPCVMDYNRGRHRVVLTYWECKISCIHFCRWLPNYISCLCHLSSHCCSNIICTAEGTHCFIVISLHYHVNHMLVLHSPACRRQYELVYAPHTQIHTFMRAGITNLTDIASECPSPLICYMNIKQFSGMVKAV